MVTIDDDTPLLGGSIRVALKAWPACMVRFVQFNIYSHFPRKCNGIEVGRK